MYHLTQAQIFVIPAAHTIRVNPELEPKGSSSVAWWVIVTSILAAVIVITVVGVLLRVVSNHYNFMLSQWAKGIFLE